MYKNMNLNAHLENLRSKPENVRRRYAFLSSLGFTSIIFVFWIASFSIGGSAVNPSVASTVNKAGSPGQSMIAGVGAFFVDIKDMIFGPKKMVYSSIEIVPGK